MRCGAGLVVVGMPQAAGPAPVVGNWREWNLEQFQKSPVLAEGADRWWNGVCSLNRPTHDATFLSLSLSLSPSSTPSHPFLCRFPCPTKPVPAEWLSESDIEDFQRPHFGIATIPWHLLCFVAAWKSSLCHPAGERPGASKMGWLRTGWGTADDSLPLTREGNRIAWPRSANIRRGLVGGV